MALYSGSINDIHPIRIWGKVTRIVGLIIEGYCPYASVGSLCELTPLDGAAKFGGFERTMRLYVVYNNFISFLSVHLNIYSIYVMPFLTKVRFRYTIRA